MQEEKKIILFRILAILLLFIPLGFSIWFLISYCTANAGSYIIHIFTTCVMIFFICLQLFLFVKNMKKQVIIYDIAFNENKTVNHTATIFVTVGEVLALGLTIAMAVLVFQQSDVQNQMTIKLLLSIFIFMLVNCSIFLLFIPFFKQKEFDIRDLLK